MVTSLRRVAECVPAFLTDIRGSIATMAGLSVAPIALAVAGSMEYSNTLNIKQRTLATADATIIAATTHARDALANGEDESAAFSKAEAFGKEFFKTTIRDDLGALDNVAIDLRSENNTLIAEFEFPRVTFPTIFGSMTAMFTTFNVETSASLDLASFLELHFLVDTSISMGIGATDFDQQTMQNTVGCAVACHSPPGTDFSPSNIEDVEASGATTRMDVVKGALDAVLTRLRNEHNDSANIAVAIHTFSNTLTTRVAVTSNLGTAQIAVPDIGLAGEMDEGGTNISHTLDTLSATLGSSGSGLSAASPKKYVILLTDGVEGNVKYTVSRANPQDAVDTNFVEAEPFVFRRPEVYDRIQTLSAAACHALVAATGAEIIVLETEYVVPTVGDTAQFNAMQPVIEAVPAHSADCATRPEFVFAGTTPNEIEQAFFAAVEQVLADSGPRLTQ